MIDRRYMTRWVLPFAGLLLMAQGARSQQPMRTTLSLTTKAGYLTNAYLAPAYPVWEQTARAPFVSVKPRAGLTWSGGGQRLSLWGSGQLTFFPEDGRRWKLGQGQLRYALVFSDSWSGGLYGAATRSQTTFGQWLFWGAPYARWQITSRFHLELQTGATAQRYDAGTRPAGNFQRTTSPFVTVTSGWRRGRWSAEGRLYYSRTVETATDGLGLALQAARQLTDVLRVGLSAGADQYAFPPDASRFLRRAYAGPLRPPVAHGGDRALDAPGPLDAFGPPGDSAVPDRGRPGQPQRRVRLDRPHLSVDQRR